jgi:uncharacterized LabA/DUF88 family protein
LQRAVLFLGMDKKQRTEFYVDGFNFYYGLKHKNWKKYYWIDLVKFCEKFLRSHQDLVEVCYFSAIPINRGKQERQDLFLSANKLNKKFSLSLGKFLVKEVKLQDKVVRTYEEKQTDVNIAVKMIRDVVLDRCDISILITADRDLTPAVDFIKEYKPSHKIFIYFPPSHFSYDLKQRATKAILLDNHVEKFEASMLAEEIVLPNGYVLKRPEKWK